MRDDRGDILDHAGWMATAEREYGRQLDLLRSLRPDDWSRPTDCAAWDVRQLTAHLVGSAELLASPREAVRQARRGWPLRAGGDLSDGMNALHVMERQGRTGPDLVADFARAVPRSLRARRRLPSAIRTLRVPFGPPLGTRPVGYLFDCIATRDGWMHRIDLSRATGREPVLTADHDAPIVADVQAEWARTHGSAYDLELTGPAGGHWARGENGPHLSLDAVEFCRILSGRGRGDGLLAVSVPF